MPVSREPSDRTIRVPRDAPTLAGALKEARDPTQRVDVVFESGYVVTERT